MRKQTHIRFDWAVKKLLRSKVNFGILEGFLSELLQEEIKIQEILESEGNRELENDKSNRVDIMVKNSKGELIIVEIQNTRELDYFYKILYNTSKAITEHMDKGMTYSQVKKIITVSVVYFDIGQGEDYIYHGNTRFAGCHHQDLLALSETQKQLFKRPSVESIYPDHFIIRVNDFDDVARDSLDEWIYFFKYSEIKDEFKARGLAEAREKLMEMNLPPEERAAYNKYLENLSFEASVTETINFERKYAHETGIEKGKTEKTMEIARKLKEQGMDIDSIRAATGLDRDSVTAL